MKERERGFTLVEAMIYTGLLFVIGIPLVSAILVSTRALAEGDIFSRLAERNRTILFRLNREVRKSISTSVVIGNGGKMLTITEVAGLDASGSTPGDDIRFELTLDAGESLNGTDDDKDGLVDEGSLVRRNLTTGEVVPLAGEINIAASSFSLSGTAVSATIANFGFLRKAGEVFQISRTMTVSPRN